MEDYTFDFVNFDDYVSNSKIVIKDHNNNYDTTTTETYRIKRLYKIDPLTDENIIDNHQFKIYEKWDPYTGNRIGID